MAGEEGQSAGRTGVMKEDGKPLFSSPSNLITGLLFFSFVLGV